MQLRNIKKVGTDFKLNTNRTNPPSELTKDNRVDVMLLPLAELRPYKYQARRVFDEEGIKVLAETIRQHGIRNPLTVIFNKEEDNYEIVSGERRFRAAQIIGLEKVPCIILKDSVATQEIALIENIQRKDLHPIELLEGIQGYIERNPDVSKEALCAKIGITRQYLYKLLKLSRLTPEVREIALEKKVGGINLYNLADIPQEGQLNSVLKLNQDVRSNGGAGAALERAMNKKCKVLQMSIKDGNIDIDTNLHVLPGIKKLEAITLLKGVIEKLEADLI